MENILNDTRWAALVARDSNADGQFYYSVKTMGVYCRPSCKSRLPRPENVAFHETSADAEKAGFRPCKRCKPNIARQQIRYGLRECSLGWMLAATTDCGVRAILFGDDSAALEKDLRARFPQASLMLQDVPSSVSAFIEQPSSQPDFPLDMQGTAFQQRVWRALMDIPPGATSTYTEIAKRIGSPQSVRAVAQACAANPLAIAIPCHRVVRSDGAISGYRWGVERKRAMLDREARG